MKISDRRVRPFFSLLRSGLHERPLTATELAEVSALDASAWASLTVWARQQAVTGLIYRALTHLPRTVQVPGDVVMDLMARAEETMIDNRHKAAVSESLLQRMRAQGLTPTILKGTTVAAFYAHPELRESGDIDLFVPEDQLLRAQDCLPEADRGPDGSFHGRIDDVDIDVHDQYFDLHVADALLPAVGTPEATILMLSSHILKHVIGPGVGVRQCCDLVMACQALDGQYDPSALKELFRQTGTLNWNRLLFSFLADWLYGPDPFFSSERVSSLPLLRIVLEGGNFGHFAAGRRPGKLNTLGRFLRRLPFSLRYAPRETFLRIVELIRGNLFRST